MKMKLIILLLLALPIIASADARSGQDHMLRMRMIAIEQQATADRLFRDEPAPLSYSAPVHYQWEPWEPIRLKPAATPLVAEKSRPGASSIILIIVVIAICIIIASKLTQKPKPVAEK